MSDSPDNSVAGRKSLLWRVALLVLIGLAIAAMSVVFGAHGPHLSELKDDLDRLMVWKQHHEVVSALLFFVTYVIVTACSLPVALFITLAGGYLFGFWLGLALVSFASTLGATLAFVAARLLAREAVQTHFADRLGQINRGLERDGASYLFTLRLVPAVPFFVVNLAMGLTPIRATTFYWVSQVGMLPMTAVYVNAGTQLAGIDNLHAILSPGLVVALTLAGLFPWLARALLGWYRRWRLYARWRRPGRFDRNLVVIGAGAAGLVASFIAASTRARVTLVEAAKMGGDCLNYGCVPSKTLIRSARMAHDLRDAGRFGLPASDAPPSFPAIMKRVGEVIARIAPHDSAERYRSLGVEVLEGRATIRDPWTVEVALADGSQRSLTTRSILIATGAEPVVPPLPGIDRSGYVTSDTLWERFATLERAPSRLLVLGGGAVGCELAQAFARLGSRVTLVEAAPRLLGREDPELCERARQALEADGVEVLAGCRVSAFDRDGETKWAMVERDGSPDRLEYDQLICAVGRRPRLGGLGLDRLGIPDASHLGIDARLQTAFPNILVAGDVTGTRQFTHMAAHEAWYATVNALFRPFYAIKLDDRLVPRVTFTDPELAAVGLSEQEARARGIACEVTRFDLSGLDRAVIDGAEDGFVKVLTPRGSDRILGVAIAADHAGELLAEFVLAMKHGLGLRKILGTIHAYPTWSEAGRQTAGAWRRAHVPAWAMRWLERFHGWRRGDGA